MNFDMYKKTIIIVIFLRICFVFFAQEENRLSLVIGNSEYTSGKLNNAVNDANKVSAKLSTLGFDVILKKNTSNQDLGEAVNDFTNKATNYDVALFYYAGHGIQSEGCNYLIPINDDRIEKESDLRYYSEDVNRLLSRLEESGCKLKIIILDACRNNPFERSWHRSASGKGLAFLNAPDGTLIAYSTSPGSVADDGSNAQNSPYTTAFLHTLDKSYLSIFEFFNEVGSIVRRSTNNKQTPWLSTSPIEGRFIFNPTKTVETKKNIKFNLFPSNARIKFGNTYYENGKTLTFNIGSTYEYVVEADGYQSQKKQFTVNSSSGYSMNISLEKNNSTQSSFTPNFSKQKFNSPTTTVLAESSIMLLESDMTALIEPKFDEMSQIKALIKIQTTNDVHLYTETGTQEVEIKRKSEKEIWVYVPSFTRDITIATHSGTKIAHFHLDDILIGGNTYKINLKMISVSDPKTHIIKGCVIDSKTMQPQIGASVNIVGTNLWTIADVDGEFILKDVPNSATKLKVFFIGYNDVEVDISPTTDNLKIHMEPKRRRW